ncbi:MerR family transcriptional regulator [bacterium endosymbiont of Escarpia laminata]|nr:MAG: MerR family transcriptional regulator [bacterium endosymbiont of Escarpia laminata]
MKGQERNFTLDELVGLVDLPRRTVRYYIQIGLIEKPEGLGRGAHYSQLHLEQLLEIRKWQQAGLSLERIRELLHASGGPEGLVPPSLPRQRGSLEVWSHLVVDEGVELVIEAGRANLMPEQVRALAEGVMALYENIRSKEES